MPTPSQLMSAALGVALVLAAVGPVSAEQGHVSRDALRRALLDHCVYSESGRPEVNKKQGVTGACQCAANQTLRSIKESDLAQVSSTRSVPDEWVATLRASFAQCRK